MIDKIEVGKKYKHGLGIIEVLGIGREKVFYEYIDKENQNELTKYIYHALENWNEIERETITLTEHICDNSCIIFLTNDFKYIALHTTKPNNLIEIQYKEKCIKAPNARSYKVYADTLEPVK